MGYRSSDPFGLKDAICSSTPAKGVTHRFLKFLWRPWTTVWLSVPAKYRFWTYQALERIGEKLYDMRPGSAKRLPFGLYLKFGPVEGLRSEALATMFVASNTTIPVPTVLDFVEHPRGAAMIMTCLPGTSVSHAIHSGELPREEFEATMQDWLSQLRGLPTPSHDIVASFDGSKCMCHRVLDTRFGPFPNIAAFHEFLFSGLEHLREVTEKSYSKPHRICFTHGDIHMQNILFYDGKLSGLVDWECAGWYPEYWEYIVAIYHTKKLPYWVDSFGNIFPQYADELAAEREYWKLPW
ncbi:unnamed protein product [Somion occarium]|uniref:Aminoglycoside phosphotransferase domain-containing protein n=1 Tax=Somion occarium TaxID=3059160 RepID=A0ABP1CRI0_9APHY